MVGLAKKLEVELSTAFKQSQVELKQLKPSKRIGGQVVWSGFAGKSQLDRQRQLRKAVDSARSLTDEEKLSLSLIMTLTPEEITVMAEAD